jgi:hypothetical protein
MDGTGSTTNTRRSSGSKAKPAGELTLVFGQQGQETRVRVIVR